MVGKTINPPEGANNVSRRDRIRQADEELLAALGYKQEFKREFSPLEVSYEIPQ